MDLLKEMTVRPMRSSDYNFVLANWAQSFRDSPWAGTTQNHHWASSIKTTLDCLTARGMSTVVLCNKEYLDQICAFLAFEVAENGVYVLHYAYTKPDFRKEGFQRALFSAVGVPQRFIYTHRTPQSDYFKGGKHVRFIACRKHLEPIRNFNEPS